MEFDDEVIQPPSPVAVLGPCLALELAWAVRAAAVPELRSRHAALLRLFEDQPELVGSFEALWSDGLRGAPELLVAAHHAGALGITGYAMLRWELDQAWPTVNLAPDLRSETPEDRATIRARLADLAQSRARRRIYLELLGDVWSSLERWWTTEGQARARAASTVAIREVGTGATWADIVARSSAARHVAGRAAVVASAFECGVSGPASIAHCVEGADIGAGAVIAGASRLLRSTSLPMLLVPAMLSGPGTFLELPGAVLVGFDASRGGPATPMAAGPTSEQLVRRLRALADPTRVEILGRLATGASSVGELSTELGVAQATVSGHVKLLRDAGIVSGTRRAGRVDLEIRRDAVEELAHELATSFGTRATS